MIKNKVILIVGITVLSIFLQGCGGGKSGGNSTITTPNPPSKLSATVLSATSIGLAWEDASANETGFRIEKSNSATTGFSEVGTVAANTKVYTVNELLPDTTYYFRVQAYNAAGSSNYSEVINITTQAVEQIPNAPSNLTATAVSATAIKLAWSDNSQNETAFIVEQSDSNQSGFIQAGTTAANVSVFNISGLTPNTTYYFRVRASNAIGNSGYSNVAETTTPVVIVTPAAPHDLHATALSAGLIRLGWIDQSGNETGFRIERSTSGISGFTQIGTVGSNICVYDDSTGLNSDTTYYYRVCAFNAAGNSEYSGTVSASTQPAIPASPTNLQTSSLTGAPFIIYWKDNSNNEAGFRIYVSINGNTAKLNGAVGPNVTSYTYSSYALYSGTTYWFMVYAYNAAGESTDFADVGFKVP